jgi:hypothetical protein
MQYCQWAAVSVTYHIYLKKGRRVGCFELCVRARACEREREREREREIKKQLPPIFHIYYEQIFVLGV